RSRRRGPVGHRRWFRSSPAKEDVVRDSWQEENIVQPVNHERAEEEPQDPSLVLFDLALERSIERTPGGKRNKRDEQVSRAHTQHRAVRRPAMNEQGDDGRRHHERQEQRTKRSMPARSLAAEREQPDGK